MRKLCLLAALISPMAVAQVLTVESHSLMRLPNTASTLQLERLDVADNGTLLIPSNVTQLNVTELHLGHDARIAIVPGEQSLQISVGHALLASGSQITSRGAPGTYLKAARPGRNLNLRIASLNAPELSVDARGGDGAPGFVGLDGGNGQEPGCTWGAAGRGADGDNGGDGRAGAPGALVPVACRVSGARLGRAANPKAAWCIAPMAARAVARAMLVSLGLSVLPDRSRFSACKQLTRLAHRARGG